MTTQTEALKLALEALELCNGSATVEGVVIYTDLEIAAIKEALAQPEQEPVAKYIGECSEGSLVQLYEDVKKGEDFYTTPPQRTWVGLTDEEMRLIDPDGFEDNLPQMIQQALKEKNAK